MQENLNLAPVIGNSFENIRLLDKKDIYAKAYIDEGGFDSTDTQLQSVEMDDQLSLTPEFPYNWMYDGTKKYIKTGKKCISSLRWSAGHFSLYLRIREK